MVSRTESWEESFGEQEAMRGDYTNEGREIR